MKIPKDKSFYIIELKKDELSKIISDENTKRKEDGFNINYLNNELKGLNENKEQNSIVKDKFGTLYIQGFKNNEHFKATSKNSINSYKKNNRIFLKFIKDKNTKNRTKFLEKGFWTKRQNMKLSFHVVGFPELSVYLSK